MPKPILTLTIILMLAIFLVAGCTETTNNQNQDDQQFDDDEDQQTPDDEETNDETEPQTPSNLVAHWKFDESSGTTATDETGKYDATVHGEASWTAGKKDNALYFDGSNDYVSFPQEAVEALGELTQGTIAFWFNYTSVLDEQTIMPIFHFGNQNKDDQDSIFIIEIGHSDTNSEQLSTDPDNKNLYVTWTDLTADPEPILCYDSNQNMEENTWIHFAVVVGPEGNTGYLNGEKLTNRRYNFGSATDQYFLDDIPVQEQATIGYGKTHWQISPDFVYYKGYIDDLRIYNEPLNQTTIQSLL